jgi:hypothetical protein
MLHELRLRLRPTIDLDRRKAVGSTLEAKDAGFELEVGLGLLVALRLVVGKALGEPAESAGAPRATLGMLPSTMS